jgi:lipoprotein-anchoring transpeptidase ErfK/SrfK
MITNKTWHGWLLLGFFLAMIPLNAMAMDDPANEMLTKYGPSPGGYVIVVRIEEQHLYLYRNGAWVADWPVSTALKGIGNQEGSLQTPLGAHRIAKMIGAHTPAGTIFRSRVNSRKIAAIIHEDRATTDDYVTSRILWLEGLEPGINKGGKVDSYRRFIYIHGTHEEGRIGKPASKGCIRMRNDDVIRLFEMMQEGVLVYIEK